MNLLIDGKLTLPPSEVSCFRDVTLYGSVFGKFNILIDPRQIQKDMVWMWLKQNGAHDFVDYILSSKDFETGIKLSSRKTCNICVTSITADNLSFIISRLKQYAHLRQSYHPKI